MTVDYTYQDFWTLVRDHRRGDESSLNVLQLLANGEGRAADRAASYLAAQGRSEEVS